MENNRKAYRDYVASTSERDLSNTELYDKGIMAISTVLLAVSMIFTPSLVPLNSFEQVYLLPTSWFSLYLAIISVIISFPLGNIALRVELEKSYRFYMENDEEAIVDLSTEATINTIVNKLSGVFFIIGLFLLILFYSINI